MGSRKKTLLLFGVALLLILNPVYLFPGDGLAVERVTYEAERVENPTAMGPSVPYDAVLECGGETHYRECVQAQRVGYDGEMRVPNVTAHLEDDERGLFYGWDFVRFEAGYARPNASLDDGTLVLSFEPVSSETVMSRYAAPFESVSEPTKEAVRTGNATISRSPNAESGFELASDRFVADDERFVERDGTFYRLRLRESTVEHRLPEWVLSPLLRVAAMVAGVVLLYRLVDPSQ